METYFKQYPCTSSSTATCPDYLTNFESMPDQPLDSLRLTRPLREYVTESRPSYIEYKVEYENETSKVSFGKNQTALNVLLEAYGDFPENWDGEGASALNRESFKNACLFAENLPLDYPPPEVSAFPDGDVILDWSSSKGLISLQFLSNGGYVYALNDNKGQVSGKEKSFLPTTPVLDLIKRVMCS